MPGLIGQSMQGGWLQNVPPNATPDAQNAALNTVIDRLNTLLKTQVFSDGTIKRMIIGYQKDGWGSGKDFGIKISQAGIDVTSATDAQLLFRMDLQTWSFYDPTTGKNFMQMGILPDSTGGFVIAAAGFNVSDAF